METGFVLALFILIVLRIVTLAENKLHFMGYHKANTVEH